MGGLKGIEHKETLPKFSNSVLWLALHISFGKISSVCPHWPAPGLFPRLPLLCSLIISVGAPVPGLAFVGFLGVIDFTLVTQSCIKYLCGQWEIVLKLR
jgi:hypothetical protein